MKRSEIKVGEAYYFDSSPKWADASGYREPGKAVVIDAGWWMPGERRNDWKPVKMRDGATGAGVLVDLTQMTGPYHDRRENTRRAVPLVGHLRGPYDETKAQVDAAIAARREREDAHAKEREALTARKEAVRARAKRHGINVNGAYDSGAEVIIGVGSLERLLDAYDKLTAKE